MRIRFNAPNLSKLGIDDSNNIGDSSLRALLVSSGLGVSLKRGVIINLLYFIILIIALFSINTIRHHNYIKIDKHSIIVDSSPESLFTLFFSPYDISISKYEIEQIGSCNLDSICIDLGGITDFSLLTIEPDSKTQTKIIYKAQNKIETIKTEGLSFYAKFPERQNVQAVRIFIVTALLTIFLQKIIRLIGKILMSLEFSQDKEPPKETEVSEKKKPS